MVEYSYSLTIRKVRLTKTDPEIFLTISTRLTGPEHPDLPAHLDILIIYWENCLPGFSPPVLRGKRLLRTPPPFWKKHNIGITLLLTALGLLITLVLGILQLHHK